MSGWCPADRVYGEAPGSDSEEIAYLLEQRGDRYALLDLDYLSWTGKARRIARPNSG
jgi:hypothetical protein